MHLELSQKCRLIYTGWDTNKTHTTELNIEQPIINTFGTETRILWANQGNGLAFCTAGR